MMLVLMVPMLCGAVLMPSGGRCTDDVVLTPMGQTDTRIRVRVRVLDTVSTSSRELSKTAVPAVNIACDGKSVGTTNGSGECVFKIEPGTGFTLNVHFYTYHRFFHTYAPNSIVTDTTLVVYLKPRDFNARSNSDGETQLQKVTVREQRRMEKAKITKPRPKIVKTVKRGNTLASSYFISVPTSELTKCDRIVCQPYFKDAATNQIYYTEPIVLDAPTYHIAQMRMYGFRADTTLTPSVRSYYPQADTHNPVHDPLSHNMLQLNAVGRDTLPGIHTLNGVETIDAELAFEADRQRLDKQKLKYDSRVIALDSITLELQEEFDDYYGAFSAKERKQFDRRRAAANKRHEQALAEQAKFAERRKAILDEGNERIRNLKTEVINLSVPMEITINDPDIKNNHHWVTGGVMAIEDFDGIRFVREDTISEGVRDPMRFLNVPLRGELVSDPKWYPDPETNECKSNSSFNIEFVVGRPEWVQNEHNTRQFAALRDTVTAINRTKGAAVRSVIIRGTASPEGNYETNLRLANSRMNAFREAVAKYFDPAIMANAKWETSQNTVATWHDAAEMLRRKGYSDYADEVERISHSYVSNDKTWDMNRTFIALRRLPYYSLISDSILPQLRKVDFEIRYAVEREYTVDEIEAINVAGGRLYAYDMFKYYRNYPDAAKQLNMVERSYAEDCKQNRPGDRHFLYANDYAAMLLNASRHNSTLLRNYAQGCVDDFLDNAYYDNPRRLPVCVVYNQLCAALADDEIDLADTLDFVISRAPEQERALLRDYPLAQSLLKMKNGIFDEDTHRAMASLGAVPEVVWYLSSASDASDAESTEKIRAALTMCNTLCDSMATKITPHTNATALVLRAICYSRLANVVKGAQEMAVANLARAFELEPKLEARCQGEADLQKPLKQLYEMRNNPKPAPIVAESASHAEPQE